MMGQMKWATVSQGELETIVNIDYAEDKISIYTNKKSVSDRIIKKGYSPSRLDKIDGRICGATFEVDKSKLGNFLKAGVFGYSRGPRISAQISQEMDI